MKSTLTSIRPNVSKELLRKVRAAFVAQGTSLNAWCMKNEVVRRTAEQALTGENRSRNAATLARRIITAAGGVE